MESYSTSCAAQTVPYTSHIFTSAVQFFAAAQCALAERVIPEYDVPNHSEFDIIIVGAGSAGSVLAYRLSEVKQWNVLLVEAGGDPPPEAYVPNLDSTVYRTKHDWSYLSVDDGITRQALKNGTPTWTRGKMLGGSSSINGMVYIQGSDQDFQSWYDAGNPEWSVPEVRRCFRKAENLQDQSSLENRDISNHYGHDGPLVINKFNTTFGDFTNKILQAWDEIGIKNVPDLNVANALGSGLKKVTAANGERQSTNRAFLNKAIGRENLKVIKNGLVTKVLINEKSCAYGIEVEKDSQKYEYYAKKEVIVSAGAINSPQILMLSGIGPKDHLTSTNVPVILDSPMVGQNLQDHSMIFVPVFANGPSQGSEAETKLDALMYLYNRTGFLAHHVLLEVLAFYSAQENATYPDYQAHHMIVPKNNPVFGDVLANQYRYKDIVADPIMALNKEHTIIILAFNLLHPKSLGNISLVSNNYKDYPKIFANCYQDPDDLESTAIGIKMMTRILETKFFRSIGAFITRSNWPPCDELEWDSIEYWKCFSLSIGVSVFHPVGTCKMGPDPKTSVVDSRLRVHGIKNLRVIDASIMPTLTSGNTNAPTIMIGERGAELVKEDHGIAI